MCTCLHLAAAPSGQNCGGHCTTGGGSKLPLCSAAHTCHLLWPAQSHGADDVLLLSLRMPQPAHSCRRYTMPSTSLQPHMLYCLQASVYPALSCFSHLQFVFYTACFTTTVFLGLLCHLCSFVPHKHTHANM